jgi:hypothetical protein
VIQYAFVTHKEPTSYPSHQESQLYFWKVQRELCHIACRNNETSITLTGLEARICIALMAQADQQSPIDQISEQQDLAPRFSYIHFCTYLNEKFSIAFKSERLRPKVMLREGKLDLHIRNDDNILEKNFEPPVNTFLGQTKYGVINGKKSNSFLVNSSRYSSTPVTSQMRATLLTLGSNFGDALPFDMFAGLIPTNPHVRAVFFELFQQKIAEVTTELPSDEQLHVEINQTHNTIRLTA